MNLYVANINFDATENDVRDLFSEYGSISSCKLVTDRENGRSRGFAFVEFEDRDDAKTAIDALNGSEFMGRKLVVSQAKPKKN